MRRVRGYARQALSGAFWVAKRLGAGMLFLCCMSALVWLVFELSETVRDALVAVGLGVSFLVGHVLVGAFGDETDP